MQRLADRLPNGPVLVRIALVVFVLAWVFGPYALQAAVPIWVPFLIALGLELNFFAGGLRPPPTRRADRGPQDADLDLYGYGGDAEELLLVRDGTQEIWVPYAGETPEEVEGLIAEARDLPEEEEAVAEAAPEEGRSRPALRSLLAGLLVIGGLAAIFWLTESRTGWNGLARTHAPRRPPASPARPPSSQASPSRSGATSPATTSAPSSTRTASPRSAGPSPT